MEYAWGSKTFIPELMGKKSPSKKPQAELWMGSHTRASSMVFRGGKRIPLVELIARNPQGALGESIAKRFSNRLPFLFKILAASRPLSIQAHPNKKQAIDGFEQEFRKGIALNAPERNYRDDNHKPELICSLKPFWALKGFRRIGDIIRLLELIENPAVGEGSDILRSEPGVTDLKRFFTYLMTMEGDKKDRFLNDIITSIKNLKNRDPVFEWIEKLSLEYPGDMGILSPIFLNIVRLKPGEAIFIPPGELHAYLEGAGLEIMANSDNVLRGGLTSKHLDFEELVSILRFNPNNPDILIPQKEEKWEAFYPVVAEEFRLSVISLSERRALYESAFERSAEIMICTEGKATVKDRDNKDVIHLNGGVSIFVPAAVRQYIIQGKATIYKASVPFK